MRKEPFSVNDYVHVIKRGTRGMPIVRDNKDRQRFLLMLRHFNDTFSTENWFRDITSENKILTFERGSTWPQQKKIVEIVAYCLLDNHFHLLVREITEGGISKFMQRLGTGMSNHYNQKYDEKGSIFQGAYHSRTVSNDNYLQYVSVYIQVKNTLEMYPGGINRAAHEFDKAYKWAKNYPYSSLREYENSYETNILDKNFLSGIFPEINDYKNFSYNFMVGKYSDTFSPEEYANTPID